MAALGAWARERGGHSCLLQVAGGNAPALALYERLGFTEHHRYHYRLGAGAGAGVRTDRARPGTAQRPADRERRGQSPRAAGTRG